MAIIIKDGAQVLFEDLYYSVAWWESLGPGIIHLCLEGNGQQIIQCYKAGETTVNETNCSTVEEILAAVGNPPHKPIPVN
jgi:hypothetical protein